MNTIHEIEAKIAATQDHLTKRIDAMNERILEMQQRIQRDIDTEAVLNLFKSGEKIDHYRWNYEYSLSPSRRCFVSNKLILPGRKAYKGIWAVGKVSVGNSLPPTTVYPEIIWLIKEEFIVRRLKGQI